MPSILKQFFKSAKYTGALAASSRYLALQMVKRADLQSAKIIVELGPGTGAITKYVVKAMPPDARFFTFEINPEFIKNLEKKYRKVSHYNVDLLEMGEILKKEGITKVDAVISGIPFSNFSRAEIGKMLNAISGVMSKKTKFVLFAYTKLKFKIFLKKFEAVSVDYIAANIPPAYVLTLKKK